MTRNTFTWMRAAAVVALATQHATAQSCYYPNGEQAPDSEAPCSTADGSACCPKTWECLDNGLCYNPVGSLYGRYSCTDKDWNSPGCASNMCTYGMTASGGEAITQCSNHNDDWCCNADAVHVNCCQESPSPRPFFALQDGKAYATIGSNQASTNPDLSSITGLATGTGSGSSPSQTSAPASSSKAPSSAGSRSASASPTSATPFTSVQTSVSSGSAGVVTQVVTALVMPSSDPTATNPTAAANGNSAQSGGGSKSNIGLIVGCAVGIPLALALVGILVWMLRKRRQQKASPYKETLEGDGDGSSGLAGGAAAKIGKNHKSRHSRPGITEIDGNPVGPGRPISAIKGRAELDSGTGFRPGQGTPYAPDTVGLGGGSGSPNRSTWSSVPPQYSPGANHTAFSQHAHASELDGTSVMPVINEKTEGEQQYQAYRPPQQPTAELPTVKTPPEDLEKQMQK